MTTLTWIAALPVFMVFNRIRGGGMSNFTDRLPGRALYYIAVIFGVQTWAILQDWKLGLIVGLGFLIWAAPGWGLWFDLGANDDADDHRRDDWFVRIIDTLSFEHDYVALFFRFAIMLVPVCVALGYFDYLTWQSAGAGCAMFSIALVGCYHVGKRSPLGNTLSELLAGAAWWLAIGLVAMP